MSTSSRESGRTVSSNKTDKSMKKYTDKLLGIGTQKAEGVFNKLEGGNYFPETPRNIAGFTPDHIAGFNKTRMTAEGGNPLLDASQAYATKAAGGGFLNSNPFIDDIVKNQAENVANQTAQQFAGFGRFASPTHSREAGRGITAATLPLLAENYENERGRQKSAIGLLPMLDQARYTDANKMVGLGDVYQQLEQARADAAYQQQKGALGQKYSQDTTLANLILGLGSAGETGGTSTTTQYQPYNAASNILGGVLSAGSLLF